MIQDELWRRRWCSTLENLSLSDRPQADERCAFVAWIDEFRWLTMPGRLAIAMVGRLVYPLALPAH